MILKIIIVLTITATGMIGGQCKKWTRRFILPSLAVTYQSLMDLKEKNKNKFRGLIYLILMGILSMGYGENSHLRKLCKGSDKATRIVIGLLVSLPFLFFDKWWACIILPLVWSFRAGGVQLPNGKDILFEDLARYSCIGLLVVT